MVWPRSTPGCRRSESRIDLQRHVQAQFPGRGFTRLAGASPEGREPFHRWVEGLERLRYFDKWTQGGCLTRMTEVLEQIAQTPRGRVLIGCGCACEPPRIGARTEIVDDLRRTVEAGGLIEVPHG